MTPHPPWGAHAAHERVPPAVAVFGDCEALPSSVLLVTLGGPGGWVLWGALLVDGSEAGDASLNVQQAYEGMMRGQVAPALRVLGFTGTSRVFRIRRGGQYGEIRWQKNARQIRRQLLRFTGNVFYWWENDTRIGALMPEPETDVWWELAGGQPSVPVGDSVIAAVRRYALPAILAGLEELDRSEDPGVRWARVFRPVPEISARLPDGGGADRTAWYLRPAGSEADEPFAELASDIALFRLDAARYVAGYALSDPRTVPALLDRLERDPSPVVRKMAASRMLTPVAYDTRVRAALQAAATSDHDPMVRWAARYALRVDLRPGAGQRLRGVLSRVSGYMVTTSRVHRLAPADVHAQLGTVMPAARGFLPPPGCPEGRQGGGSGPVTRPSARRGPRPRRRGAACSPGRPR